MAFNLDSPTGGRGGSQPSQDAWGGTYNSTYGYNTVPSDTAAPFREGRGGNNMGFSGGFTNPLTAPTPPEAPAQPVYNVPGQGQAAPTGWGSLNFTPTWNNNAGYNPMHYLSDDSTRSLAGQLGGSPVQVRTTTGPFNLPPENMLDFQTGNLHNAGLLANQFRAENAPFAQAQLQAELAREMAGPNAVYTGSGWGAYGMNPQATMGQAAAASVPSQPGPSSYINSVLGGGNGGAQTQTQSLASLLSGGGSGVSQLLALIGMLGGLGGGQSSQLPPSNYWYSRPRYSIIG
jgi:hypothetical protein